MTGVVDGWFYEKSSYFPGQAFGLEIEEILFSGKSKYQEVLVFKSKSYGIVLALDGIVQCSSRDEFSYQEMITNVPLNSHPDPKKVLIIGGGDGGVAREAGKHPCVESIDLCEIDEMVIEVSKKFIPEMAKGFEDPKVTLFVEDGFSFLKNHENHYDVIIADITDPEGPANRLFGEEFYELMKKALKPDGIVCVQGESIWLDLPVIKEILTFSKKHYPVVSYAHSLVPTYTCGEIGYILCSLNKDMKFGKPVRTFTPEQMSEMNLQYYNEEIHSSSFVFPTFVKKELGL
eukprot:gene15155-16713_t